jgi:ribosomal-protein-alanine N-acetyltransferase
MLFSRPLTTRLATPEDRNAVQTLTRYEERVHLHLDWKPVEDWLGAEPFLVLERGRKMVAALACPPDRPDIAWLRLLVVAEGVEVRQAWQRLWPEAEAGLRRLQVTGIAALSLDDWTRPLYESGGLQPTHAVVVLSRPPRLAVPRPRQAARIRAATALDTEAIVETDTAAFAPPWQLSAEMIRLAVHQAEYLSVAESEGQVVGYQLTTPSRTGAHLARLAVRPEQQGRGLGEALVHDLIEHLNQRGGRELTVNTQDNNRASLTVYQRLGFELTGARFPVYQRAL